jgi:hypothetical protein
MDQIFPHELLHVIVRQLAGERRGGGSNQVHAIGVRTDPETAFEEGFAEHAQVMALDDADALPETRAVAGDVALRAWADRKFDDYERALTARFSPGARARIAFPLWFGRAEQTLRYHGVRENLFSLARPVPPRLRSARDPYAAYLFENILPADPAIREAAAGRPDRRVVAVVVCGCRSPASRPAFRRRPLDRAYSRCSRRSAAEAGKHSGSSSAPRRPSRRARRVRRAVEETRPDARRAPGTTRPRSDPQHRFRPGTTMYDQFRLLDHPDLNGDAD